jgi:protein phosphatase
MDILRKLFPKPRRSTPASVEASVTAPLTDQQISAIMKDTSMHFEMKQLVAGVSQSIGKQRDHNEDSLLALTSTISGNSGNVPFGLYIVADGMGGHQYGEVASNAAVRIMAGFILRKLHTYLYSVPTQPMQESLQEVIESSVVEAHRFVQSEAPGGGTTVTAALVLGEQVTLAHVGDSRAYSIFPDGRVEPITRDHSLVKRLEELGHLNRDEAANFPHRNVLIRAVGQGDVIEPDVLTIPFPQPGYLMICSDGLWGVVSDKDIYRAVADANSLPRACQNLVEAANAAGGPDNISVVLVQLIG